MESNYIRNKGVGLLLWMCCVQGNEHKMVLRHDVEPSITSSVKQLEEKIMNSWNEVNIARAISFHNAEAFSHRIVKSYLELYEVLGSTLLQECSISEELLPIYRILKGLCISHDAWCSEQNPIMTAGVYYLMIAIVQVWRFATKGSFTHNLEQTVNLLESEKKSEFGDSTP